MKNENWIELALKGLNLAFDNNEQVDPSKSDVEISEAKKYFYESLEKEPPEYWPYLKCAELVGDELEKIKLYKKAYDIEKNIFSCLKLIEIYLNDTNSFEANIWLERLIAIDSNNASIIHYKNLINNIVNNLPKDFDASFYFTTHNELCFKSKLDGVLHYLELGRKEFRQYKPSIEIPFKEKEKQEIVLFTQYYQCDEKTRNEIQYCLKQNLNNVLIDKLVVFCENGCFTELNDFCNLCSLKNKKLLIVPTDDRLSYKQWFDYSFNRYPESIKILANSDIYFDETIDILYKLDYKNNILYSCSRIDLSPTGELVQSTVDKSPESLPINNTTSQDCWIFKNKLLNFDCDFILGYENCDVLLKIKSTSAGCDFVNLYEHMKCIHVDSKQKKVHKKYNLATGDFILPTIFVITPSFNSERTISRTINSVISQKGNFLIHYRIQDGGSTDNTKKIVDSFVSTIQQNPHMVQCEGIKIEFVSKKDSGMYDAISEAILDLNPSEYSWIGWINSDDTLAEGALSTLALIDDQFDKDYVQWVCGELCLRDGSNGSRIFKSSSNNSRCFPREVIKQGLCDGYHWDFIQQEGVFFRKNLWDKCKAAEWIGKMKLAGDWNLWRTMALHAELFMCLWPMGSFFLENNQLSRSKKHIYELEMSSYKSFTSKKDVLKDLSPEFFEYKVIDGDYKSRRLQIRTLNAQLKIKEYIKKQDLIYKIISDDTRHPYEEYDDYHYKGNIDTLRERIDIPIYKHNWQFPAITEKHAAEMAHKYLPESSYYTYFAFPWATLIDTIICQDMKRFILYDALTNLMKEIQQKKAVFSVCQHIQAEHFLDIFLHAGINVLYWSHASIKNKNQPRFDIAIKPFPLYPTQVAIFLRYFPDPQEKIRSLKSKSFLFSFRGAFLSHYISNSRAYIFKNLKSSKKGNLRITPEWHFKKDVYELQINKKNFDISKFSRENFESDLKEYISSLVNSKFILCPSGAGPNTIRLWESIKLGVCPVVLSDGYWHPGDPSLWESAVLKVEESEEQIKLIPEYLSEKDNELKNLYANLVQIELLYGTKIFIYDIIKDWIATS